MTDKKDFEIITDKLDKVNGGLNMLIIDGRKINWMLSKDQQVEIISPTSSDGRTRQGKVSKIGYTNDYIAVYYIVCTYSSYSGWYVFNGIMVFNYNDKIDSSCVTEVEW